MMEVKKDAASARAYALRLIKFRARTEKEIRDKLALKKYEPAVLEATVDFLKRSALLDDALFARLWVDGRIKKPLGARRLRRELASKGIRREFIEAALAPHLAGAPLALEELLRRKLKTMKITDIKKARARLYGFLCRRGFDPGAIAQAIEECLPAREDFS